MAKYVTKAQLISTHAPAGGATLRHADARSVEDNFYSRPCGRGDPIQTQVSNTSCPFLLTPLREGRPDIDETPTLGTLFLLTPLREGRRKR